MNSVPKQQPFFYDCEIGVVMFLIIFWQGQLISEMGIGANIPLVFYHLYDQPNQGYKAGKNGLSYAGMINPVKGTKQARIWKSYCDNG